MATVLYLHDFVRMQVLKALEAAQKEPKAPLSDMFTDGKDVTNRFC